jgi:hypothetical protein
VTIPTVVMRAAQAWDDRLAALTDNTTPPSTLIDS